MITIITPSYNQGDFLSQTLHSFFEKGHPEIILIDGGSVDNTRNVIEEYSGKLSFWISEEDNGQSHAINKGLKQATGIVINWINSDDYLQPDAIVSIEQAFSDQSVNVYIGRSNIVRDGHILRQSRGTDVYWGNLAKTIGQARIDQPETWWRKTVIDEIGPLNEALHYTMDRDWWVKYLLRHGLEGIKKEDTTLANFRLHGGSKTVSQSDKFNQERNSYYRSLALHYGLNNHANQLNNLAGARNIPMTNLPDQIDLDILNNSFSYFFLLLASEAYADGNHSMSRKFLDSIDYPVLSEEDRTFADKLKRRSCLPSSLIRLARKLKR